MRGDLIKVQVERIEVALPPDFVPVFDRDPSPAMVDDAILREGLERPVYMDTRHSGGVPKLFLRHGQMKIGCVYDASGVHTHRNFAQDMSDTRPGVASAYIQHPFPVYRCIDQAVDPERLAHGRTLQSDLPKRLSLNVGNFKFGQRLDAMVGNVEKQMLKVEQIASQVNGHDLTRSIHSELVSERQSRQNETAVRTGRLSFANHIGTWV